MATQVARIKYIPRTNFSVDGFNFQLPRITCYFLTHFHSDHTTGLSRGGLVHGTGLIYCTAVTAALLEHDMRFAQPGILRLLEIAVPRVIEGIRVTALEANHCPGACMLLFEVPREDGQGTENILHTGDCRWQAWMSDQPGLKGVRVDTLYLDCTYCLPRYQFPGQDVAITEMVAAMRNCLIEEPSTLFIVGSYHIGKERAYFGAAKQMQCKVYLPPEKRRVLQMLQLTEEDMALVSDCPTEAKVHVTNWGLKPDRLEKVLAEGHWKQVVGFRPTGWSFRKKGGLSVWKGEDPRTRVYGVPYSEHSSFAELQLCVRTLKPRKIVPTVNAVTLADARTIVDRFADCMDLKSDRSRLDYFFSRRTPSDVQQQMSIKAEEAVEDEEAIQQQRRFQQFMCGPHSGGLGLIDDGSTQQEHSGDLDVGNQQQPPQQTQAQPQQQAAGFKLDSMVAAFAGPLNSSTLQRRASKRVREVVDDDDCILISSDSEDGSCGAPGRTRLEGSSHVITDDITSSCTATPGHVADRVCGSGKSGCAIEFAAPALSGAALIQRVDNLGAWQAALAPVTAVRLVGNGDSAGKDVSAEVDLTCDAYAGMAAPPAKSELVDRQTPVVAAPPPLPLATEKARSKRTSNSSKRKSGQLSSPPPLPPDLAASVEKVTSVSNRKGSGRRNSKHATVSSTAALLGPDSTSTNATPPLLAAGAAECSQATLSPVVMEGQVDLQLVDLDQQERLWRAIQTAKLRKVQVEAAAAAEQQDSLGGASDDVAVSMTHGGVSAGTSRGGQASITAFLKKRVPVAV